MTSTGALVRNAIFAAIAAAVMVQPLAAAQVYQVSEHQDWTVYATENGKTCWAAAYPESSKAYRGGREADVNRGEIYMMATFHSGEAGAPEIALDVGYPLKPASEVEIEIGGASFDLFTKGQNAWPYRQDDSSLLRSLRAGAEAEVAGISSRGTKTVDTFSLLGFTAAIDAAKDHCKD